MNIYIAIYIANVDANDQLLPFSVVLSCGHNKEITIKRGESKEIKVKVIPEESTFSAISDIMNLHMVASGTFTPTGDLGNSTGSFSEEWFSINTEDDNSKAPAIRSITGISNGTNTAATNTSSSTIIIPSNSSSFHSSSTRGYDTVNVVALSLSNQPKRLP